jgi:agmatinase
MSLKFFDLNHSRDMAEIAIVPVSFDSTTSYKAGSRDGATATFLASSQLEAFDEETLLDITKHGIYTHDSIGPLLPVEDMLKKIQEVVSDLLNENKFVVTIGGEHSVSIGSIKAFYEKFGRMNIIQFDAHSDLRDTYLGSKFNHGCVMRRVYDLGNIIQIGIRAMSEEEWIFLKEKDNLPFFARNVVGNLHDSIKAILSKLEDLPTYITFDLDCLDPSIMPAVGTPAPGGLGWHDALFILKSLSENTKIVGFDVMELSPIPGYHSADFLSANLIYKILNYILSKKK